MEAKIKLAELEAIISKMSLDECYVTVLPEFGVRWREVSLAVRNARMPIAPASVARVLCRYVVDTFTLQQLVDIVGRLRLKLIATQKRTWHVIKLLEPMTNESVAEIINTLPERILEALMNSKLRHRRPELHVEMLGDIMFFSIQLTSGGKEGSMLYYATPPGEPVLLATSLAMNGVLKACVEGLGYKTYQNAKLHGPDIHSLLRITNGAWTAEASHLTSLPEYNPVPVITKHGIDYTNKSYDIDYVENIIGPNPPVLTELNINTSKKFFDRNFYNNTIDLKVQLKCENVAETLKTWVVKGALSPTSDLFQIFHTIKSNWIEYNEDWD